MMVVLMWSGSCTVRPRPRCSGVNKHVNLCLLVSYRGPQGDPTLRHKYGHWVSTSKTPMGLA